MYDGPGIQSLSSSHAIRAWHYLHSARRRLQKKRDGRLYVMGAAQAVSMRRRDVQPVPRRLQVGRGRKHLPRAKQVSCLSPWPGTPCPTGESVKGASADRAARNLLSVMTWGMGHGAMGYGLTGYSRVVRLDQTPSLPITRRIGDLGHVCDQSLEPPRAMTTRRQQQPPIVAAVAAEYVRFWTSVAVVAWNAASSPG